MTKEIRKIFDLHMHKITEVKKNFIESYDEGKPSFKKYLKFFKLIRNIIIEFIIPRLKNLKNFKKLDISLTDNNVCVLFHNKFEYKFGKIEDNIENLNDIDIFKKFYSKYLNKNLHILDQKSQDFFEYVKYKKNTKWLCIKEINNTIISSRYTPGTISTKIQLQLVPVPPEFQQLIYFYFPPEEAKNIMKYGLNTTEITILKNNGIEIGTIF